ncbi:large ribosomal subunit protein eL29-like [Saccopteryx bilineata]|uniref:large ribosomal subunit protein eL29-like n=1 Tax=Saccopteryx bilineata TaxID=59482 RepID=UPI00338FA568
MKNGKPYRELKICTVMPVEVGRPQVPEQQHFAKKLNKKDLKRIPSNRCTCQGCQDPHKVQGGQAKHPKGQQPQFKQLAYISHRSSGAHITKGFRLYWAKVKAKAQTKAQAVPVAAPLTQTPAQAQAPEGAQSPMGAPE